MTKVLVFDGWTKGRVHIHRLLNACSAVKIEFKLLHLGSWGNELNRPDEEVIDGLTVVDIKFFKGMSFKEILLLESPDLVMFLSTHTLAHRAFVRYCKFYNIPTMLLFHGIVTVQETSKPGYRVSKTAQLNLVRSKMIKILTKTLPVYVGSLLFTKATVSEWTRLSKDLWGLFVAEDTASKIFSEDSRTTHCCVYTEADVPYAMSNYGFDRENITVVGNPDFLKLGITDKDIGSWDYTSNKCQGNVIYIESALYKAGLNFNSVDDMFIHIKETSIYLKKFGCRLLLKLHPASDHLLFEQSLREFDIGFVDNDDFVRELKLARFCITEPSTLAMVPATLGVPTILARYGKLSDLQYGAILKSYPRSYVANSLDELIEISKSIKPVYDQSLFEKWLALYAGPLPPLQFSARVADTIKKLTNRN